MAQVLAKLGCARPHARRARGSGRDPARASRNIQNVDLRLAADINAYEVLRCKKIVITPAALEKLGARWN